MNWDKFRELTEYSDKEFAKLLKRKRHEFIKSQDQYERELADADQKKRDKSADLCETKR